MPGDDQFVEVYGLQSGPPNWTKSRTFTLSFVLDLRSERYHPSAAAGP